MRQDLSLSSANTTYFRHAELHTKYGVYIVEVWPVQVTMKWSAPGRRCPAWCQLAGVHVTEHLISLPVRAFSLKPAVCTVCKSKRKLSFSRYRKRSFCCVCLQ